MARDGPGSEMTEILRLQDDSVAAPCYARAMARITSLLVMFVLAIPFVTHAQEETKDHRDARMKWWREARFGMFIHWGIYSVPAGTYHDKQIPGIGEWIMHEARIP